MFPESDADWGRRPYFLWDYPLTWAEFVALLHGDSPLRRRWALSRLLAMARWEHIWRLVSIDDIARDLDALTIPDKAFWQALVGSRHPEPG